MTQRRDDYLRSLYVGGRGNATAKRYVQFWNLAFRLGLLPRRWVVLEVMGRRSGLPMRCPLGMADLDGQWYLVSMLGECNWVQNVRAAGGAAVLHRRRARPVTLLSVPVERRAEVIKRYLDQVPGARPHISVDRHEPVAEFEAIAAGVPVFTVTPRA